MSTTPEGKVKASIKKFLTDSGAYWTMPATGGYGKSGVPDFLVCLRGKFIGIEAKAKGMAHNTTHMQDQQIKAIQDAGGLSFVCDDVSQLANVFKALS